MKSTPFAILFDIRMKRTVIYLWMVSYQGHQTPLHYTIFFIIPGFLFNDCNASKTPTFPWSFLFSPILPLSLTYVLSPVLLWSLYMIKSALGRGGKCPLFCLFIYVLITHFDLWRQFSYTTCALIKYPSNSCAILLPWSCLHFKNLFDFPFKGRLPRVLDLGCHCRDGEGWPDLLKYSTSIWFLFVHRNYA